MAEDRAKEGEAEPRPEHEGAGHGSEHADTPPKPEEHIADKVYAGVDAKTGTIKFFPYNEEHEPLDGYEPRVIASVFGKQVKLEFTKHMTGITVAAALIFVVSLVTARRVLAGLHTNRAPTGKLANAIEGVVIFVRDEMVEPTGGHHLGHYTPLFITYFMLILFCNLLGMVPFGFGTATGNFGVSLALGGSVYALIWTLGIANQGPIKYLLHLVPPGTPWLLWLPMFGLELAGPAIKCFVLCIRLYANMIAGHLIVGSILNMGLIGAAIPVATSVVMLAIGVPLSLGLTVLELMVCFIQAYVFTLLAVMFVGAAVHPEH